MSKHSVQVEIIVEAETWAQGWKKVVDFLTKAQEEQRIFHYTIKNGEDSQ